jgi:hypothetical protein
VGINIKYRCDHQGLKNFPRSAHIVLRGKVVDENPWVDVVLQLKAESQYGLSSNLSHFSLDSKQQGIIVGYQLSNSE